jgi:hypothetical protein
MPHHQANAPPMCLAVTSTQGPKGPGTEVCHTLLWDTGGMSGAFLNSLGAAGETSCLAKHEARTHVASHP